MPNEIGVIKESVCVQIHRVCISSPSSLWWCLCATGEVYRMNCAKRAGKTEAKSKSKPKKKKYFSASVFFFSGKNIWEKGKMDGIQ